MIPPLLATGFLPPFTSTGIDSSGFSPYQVVLPEIVDVFGYDEHRRKLLCNLLSLRQEFHECGAVGGFQWIGGSFVERTEVTRGHFPRDIDVMTMMVRESQSVFEAVEKRLIALGDAEGIMDNLLIDSHLGVASDLKPHIVRSLTYWTALFSHTKQNVRKGYLHVSLSPDRARDREALTLLSSPT